MLHSKLMHVANLHLVGIIAAAALLSTQVVQANDRLISAAERARRSIVGIDVEIGDRKERGSGFIVEESGLIATNYQLIAGAKSGEVTLFDGERLPVARCLAADPRTGVALLAIDRNELPALTLSDDAVRPGADVLTFGRPAQYGFRVALKQIDRQKTTEQLQREFPNASIQTPFARHFGKDATWLQSTSPVSSLSCGTPLVTPDSTVVAMNAWWIDDNGQRIAFAAPSTAIKRLMPPVGSSASISMATLQRFEKPRSSQPKPSVIELPGGIALRMSDYVMSDVELDVRRALTIHYPNGKLAARFERTGDKLNGILATTYEGGAPMWNCEYVKNERNGRLIMMAEDGIEPLFASNYRKSREDGVTVLFAEGEPWLVRESKVGAAKKYHLFENMKLIETFEPKSREAALRFAQVQLEAVEASIKVQEMGIRRWVRGVDEDERWQRAAANANENRQRSAARRRQRAEENAAVVRDLQRRSYGRD